MKINTASWHYRLLDWTYDSVPKNLCPYVDKLILAIVISPFVALWKVASDNGRVILTITGIGLIAGLEVAILFESPWWIALLLGQIILYVFIGLCLVGTWIWEFLPDYPRSPREYQPSSQPRIEKSKEIKHKNPNLIAEWIEAKHERICPRLEFED